MYGVSRARQLIDAVSPKEFFKNMRRLRSYHFDVGDTNTGPAGFCARVEAYNEREALGILQANLPEMVPLPAEGSLDYLQVYLNAGAVKLSDIDSVDEIGEED